MDFYDVLNRRKTIRGFSDKEVSDAVLRKVMNAAFKVPVNDHLRQFEFVVVRGQENIACVISPVSEKHIFMQSNCLVLPFFRRRDYRVSQPVDESSLNYLVSAWAAVENIQLAATAEGLACISHIPTGNESEYVKWVVGSPVGYEFTCFLAIGYETPDAHIPKQKEIRVEDRIHENVW